MDPTKTIEDFFWSHIIWEAMSTANEAKQKKLKQRLATECKQYVALKLAEMTKKPTAAIYRGTSQQLLAEVVEKAKAIKGEL